MFICIANSLYADAKPGRRKMIKILNREIQIIDSVIAKFKREQAKSIFNLKEKRAILNKEDSIKNYQDSIFKNRNSLDSGSRMEKTVLSFEERMKLDSVKYAESKTIKPDNQLRTDVLQLENKQMREEFTLIKLDFERLKLLNELDKLLNKRKRKRQ